MHTRHRSSSTKSRMEARYREPARETQEDSTSSMAARGDTDRPGEEGRPRVIGQTDNQGFF